jgi:hypothetical protein
MSVMKKPERRSSAGESEERPVELFDFIYRDTSRISSLYAQIFSGRLTSLERTLSQGEKSTKQGEVGIAPLAKGGIALEKTDDSSLKSTIDPHDQITIDVLSYLVENNFVHTEAENATHGSIVRVIGRLFLLDRFILTLADVAFDHFIKQQRTQAKGAYDLNALKLVKALLPKLQLPSHFLLRAKDDRSFSGTIKDSGLEEPISAFYFKHGAGGLDSIYVVGIIEVSGEEVPISGQSLMAAGYQAAKAMSNLVLPEDSTRLLPLAIFRKIAR